MGRKRKTPRETTGQGVLPIYYTKVDFEQRNRTIIHYTDAIRTRNQDINQRELSKDEVGEQFTLAVLQVYAPTEPECFELLDQVTYHQIRVSMSKPD